MSVALLGEMGEWSASTRFRLLQHREPLRVLLGGVDVYLPDDRPHRREGRVGQVSFFASHAARYLRHWQMLRRAVPSYDALLVQRGLYPLGPGAIASVVEDFKGTVVYDLDDALLEVKPSLASKSGVARWLYGSQQARRLLGRADAVTVSTQALIEMLPANLATRATVLPTVPDPSTYAQAEHRLAGGVIGWAGTSGNLLYLDHLRSVAEAIQERGLGRFEVVSSKPWSGAASFRPWQLDDERDLFARFAIGVMPLPDTAYTRAKAGFKLLQYMAAGVPVVASPVGVNCALIEDSGAGFLADSPAEWLAALNRLLEDPGLRSELGAKGRSFVQRFADLEGQSQKLAELLRG